MSSKKPLIGFIGQGYVGGSYANNFEKRGFQTIRYSLELKYIGNRDRIQECDVVFVCVPTPTTPKGFDASIVAKGLSLVGKGRIAVIKSTMMPGMTRQLQKKFPSITVLCSPEFLSVATAQMNADSPFSNVIGMSKDTARHKKAAKLVHSILPVASFSTTCRSEEAELIKYSHNFNGYTQILSFNVIYDMAKHFGCDWEAIEKALNADPLIPNRYSRPVHKSGRGAGGACFIKDVAALAHLYAETVARPEGIAFLRAAQDKNIALLVESSKDLDLLEGVYGKSRIKRQKGRGRKKRR